MTPTNYEYAVRGSWDGPADEEPAVTGAKFLQTLDALSGIDPLLTDWQVYRNLKIAEDGQPRQVPLATVRGRIAEIVKKGIVHDDFGEPTPGYGYNVRAAAGVRGPRQASFSAKTGLQFFALEFGDYYVAHELSIVTYPLFKAALLAISAAWDAQWAYAQACRRNAAVAVPIDIAPGVPAFRIDSAIQVPLDPTFPKSIFHVPWMVYLSAEYAAGVTLGREILTERTPNGGLLMSATTERLDPTNPEHVRRARILAETLIDRTGYQRVEGPRVW
jgi:hypothetical protein